MIGRVMAPPEEWVRPRYTGRLNATPKRSADVRGEFDERPLCSWLQRLVDRELRRQWDADNILMKPAELANIHQHQLRANGFDPYNSLDLLTPWLRAVETIQPSTKPRSV